MTEITIIKAPGEVGGFGVSIKTPGNKIENIQVAGYTCLPGMPVVEFQTVDGVKGSWLSVRWDFLRIYTA